MGFLRINPFEELKRLGEGFIFLSRGGKFKQFNIEKGAKTRGKGKG